MADEFEHEEDEQLDQVDDVEQEQEPAEDEGAEIEETDEQEDEDDGQVVITFDGDEEDEDSPPQDDDNSAPEWVRDLRRTNRELKKQNRAQQEKLEELERQNNPEPELGAKPTLESCDFDEDDFERQLSNWYETKRQVDERKAQADAEQKAQADAWSKTLEDFQRKKSELKVPDYDDAESMVHDTLSPDQLAMIIDGAENPAAVVYGLGRNPQRLQKLASIKNPVKFSFAASKLETKMQVKNRKAPTAPEKKLTGAAPVSGAVDSTLDRLREEAGKTGDFSKVHAYRRKQRAKK